MPTDQRFAETIEYRFVDEKLLSAALTHRSSGEPNNERFEFLGDGLLDFLIAEMLFERFPSSPEGELTRLRADLVRQDSLCAIAGEIGLGGFLALGEGELKSGGRKRPSILADALEAVIAAVYLDGGFLAAKNLVRRLFDARIAKLDPARDGKDAKTRLQEFLQGKHLELPKYRIVSVGGEAHEQTFEVNCEFRVGDFRQTSGRGRSRRAAEQQAAEAALKELGV